MENNIIIGKEIELGGYKVNTKLKIKEETTLIYGYIGKAKVVWNYCSYVYPKLQYKNTLENRRMAKTAIIETLKQNNLDTSRILRLSLSNSDSYEFDTKDGVWCTVNTNGYVRGEIDGQEFVWDAKKYFKILFIHRGRYGLKVNPDRVLRRIKEDGFNDIREVVEHIQLEKADITKVLSAFNDIDINSISVTTTQTPCITESTLQVQEKLTANSNVNTIEDNNYLDDLNVLSNLDINISI